VIAIKDSEPMAIKNRAEFGIVIAMTSE